MLAAAWASAIAYAVMAILLGIIVRRFYPVPYDWWAVGKTVALASGLYTVWAMNGFSDNWVIEGGIFFPPQKKRSAPGLTRGFLASKTQKSLHFLQGGGRSQRKLR